MANEIKNITTTLQEFFSQQLSPVVVMSAFPDERAVGENERQYPAAALSIYDLGLGNERRYGGMVRTVVNNDDNETCQLRPVPVPVNLYFQVDTFCLKKADDWTVKYQCMQIFGDRQTVLTTADERQLWIIPESQTPLDHIEGSTFRTSYRFMVPVWFESARAAEAGYLVLKTQLNINDEPIEIAAAAG